VVPSEDAAKIEAVSSQFSSKQQKQASKTKAGLATTAGGLASERRKKGGLPGFSRKSLRISGGKAKRSKQVSEFQPPLSARESVDASPEPLTTKDRSQSVAGGLSEALSPPRLDPAEELLEALRGDSGVERLRALVDVMKMPLGGVVLKVKTRKREKLECFVASQAVSWIMVQLSVPSRLECAAIGRAMQRHGLIRPVGKDALFEDSSALFMFGQSGEGDTAESGDGDTADSGMGTTEPSQSASAESLDSDSGSDLTKFQRFSSQPVSKSSSAESTNAVDLTTIQALGHQRKTVAIEEVPKPSVRQEGAEPDLSATQARGFVSEVEELRAQLEREKRIEAELDLSQTQQRRFEETLSSPQSDQALPDLSNTQALGYNSEIAALRAELERARQVEADADLSRTQKQRFEATVATQGDSAQSAPELTDTMERGYNAEIEALRAELERERAKETEVDLSHTQKKRFEGELIKKSAVGSEEGSGWDAHQQLLKTPSYGTLAGTVVESPEPSPTRLAKSAGYIPPAVLADGYGTSGVRVVDDDEIESVLSSVSGSTDAPPDLERTESEGSRSIPNLKKRTDVTMMASAGALRLAANEIVASEVTFGEELARGHFGRVLRATWRATPVAVKQLLPLAVSADSAAYTAAKEEFEIEATVQSALRPHVNVVTMLGVIPAQPDGPGISLVLELVELGSLAFQIDQSRKLEKPDSGLTESERRVAVSLARASPSRQSILVGICRGLFHLHMERVVHRDISAVCSCRYCADARLTRFRFPFKAQYFADWRFVSTDL
jgi:Protein tyrosine and serine/threonine kinase/Domain found in Dishevelled, Egl-10, and Pleckstrin (DEP)